MKNYCKIPYMQIRGGSSKGVYFARQYLPDDINFRDEILLSVMGGDARQIDGLGGANQLTSKVAIVSKSTKEDCDIDFLFAQVVSGENRVDTTPNCGNILSGVGIFAIKNNMVGITHPLTKIKVYMQNSHNICELIMQTPNAKLPQTGNTSIDGVPGTAPAIICNYLGVAGSICGALFPTKNKQDTINGINITCIDNGMPVILIAASDLNKTGYESCVELNNDKNFKAQIENIRLQAGKLMNLGDVTNKVVPKVSIISPARNQGDINTISFIPHKCHSAIGVLAAASVASACLYEKCVTHGICNPNLNAKHITIEHPSGSITVSLTTKNDGDNMQITSVGLIRTARLISLGEVYPHQQILEKYSRQVQKKTCLPPDNSARQPHYKAPPNACDAHCHIFGPHSIFPYSQQAAYWPPDAPEKNLRTMHDKLGITKAVLVQASCHGTDNSAMIDAINKNPRRYRGVCIADDSFSDDDFIYLNNNGIRGVRFNFVAHLGGAPDLTMMANVIAKIKALGWHLVIHVNAEDILQYADFFAQFSLPIVVDHMGRVPAAKGVSQKAYQILLEFMQQPNWWVKICGAERIAIAPPFYDAIPYAQGLIKTAPDRILWGTDYPHPNIKKYMPNDADLLDLLPLIARDKELQHKILVANPERLYKFEERQ